MDLDLEFNIGLGFLDHARQLNRIERKLDRLIHQEAQQMASIDELTAATAANTDAVASASSLLGTLAQLVRDNAGDPVALGAIADQLDANNASLSAAVVANTPAAAPPPDV